MPETLSATVREAIEASGATNRQIESECGVSVRAISDFRNGRHIRSDTLDALAKWAGVKATRPRRRRKKKK